MDSTNVSATSSGKHAPATTASGGSVTINGGAVAIVALILAALAVGLQIRAEATIDAKIAAAMAKPEADMHLAGTNALLAKERMDRAVAQLEAKGLLKQETH